MDELIAAAIQAAREREAAGNALALSDWRDSRDERIKYAEKCLAFSGTMAAIEHAIKQEARK